LGGGDETEAEQHRLTRAKPTATKGTEKEVTRKNKTQGLVPKFLYKVMNIETSLRVILAPREKHGKDITEGPGEKKRPCWFYYEKRGALSGWVFNVLGKAIFPAWR